MPQASSLLPGMRNLSPDANKMGQAPVRPSLRIFFRILSYAGSQRKWIALVIACAVIGCTFDVVAPYYMGQAVDAIIREKGASLSAVSKIIALLLVFYAGSAFFSWMMNYFSGVVAVRTAAELRKDAFDRLNHMPLSYYDKTPHGEIFSRFVNDVDAISDGLLQGMVQLFSGIVLLLGATAFMLLMSTKMMLVILGSAILTFLLASTIVRITGKYFRSQQKIAGQLNGMAEEIFSGQREVKAYGYAKRAQQKYDKTNQELYEVGQKAQFASSLPNPTTRFVNNGTYILIGVFGWIFGGLTVGQLSSFLTYWSLFSRPINDMTNITTQIMAAFASARRIFDMMDQTQEMPDAENARILNRDEVRGEVEFDHIRFSYEPDRELIKDFSLHVNPGERVAIVGPTGAGKTTLVNLLERFYEQQEGVIRIDGVDTREIMRKSLRRSFGMVLQDTWLFDGTVKENLLYGRPEATMEEIIAATKAVHADGFIKRLPNGYDTKISGALGCLSQGQRQLLTIARAMLENPPMLILDEATSSVDTVTEQRIQSAFAKLMEGKTSFVIAHRLSTIREADLILVLDDGKIMEQGNHEQLLAAQGFYAALYNSQFV